MVCSADAQRQLFARETPAAAGIVLLPRCSGAGVFTGLGAW